MLNKLKVHPVPCNTNLDPSYQVIEIVMKAVSPLQRGQVLCPSEEVKMFNAITIPYLISFRRYLRLLSVTTLFNLAIHDFEVQKTNDLFFSIKPIKSESLAFVPLIIRTQWKYTSWTKISFTLLAEDRADFEAGYYQIDSGMLGGC